MSMMGTLVNAGAIVAGGLIGVLLKKGFSERAEQTCNQMFGLVTSIIGLNGVITNMIRVESDGGLASSGELLLFVSLVLGAVTGEGLRLEDRINGVGKRIEAKVGSGGFSAAFINASLIYCVGAMAIMGSISDGLMGDSSILFVKSALDGVCSVILGSTMGIGVAFAAIPVFLYQGTITLLAGFLAPYATEPMLTSLCSVGYALVICIGLNFLLVGRIRTANLLPALLVPIVYQLAVQYWFV